MWWPPDMCVLSKYLLLWNCRPEMRTQSNLASRRWGLLCFAVGLRDSMVDPAELRQSCGIISWPKAGKWHLDFGVLGLPKCPWFSLPKIMMKRWWSNPSETVVCVCVGQRLKLKLNSISYARGPGFEFWMPSTRAPRLRNRMHFQCSNGSKMQLHRIFIH